MGKYRAIMTSNDRDRIKGDTDLPEEKTYQAVSRVRSRIQELENDAKILEKHHPELYDELLETVCE